MISHARGSGYTRTGSGNAANFSYAHHLSTLQHAQATATGNRLLFEHLNRD